MKRATLLIALSIVSASYFQSEAAGVCYTTAGSDPAKISYYGKGNAERYDVCTPLGFKDLEKYSIKSIRAYINPDASPASASIWISSALKNQPVINPEILNESVDVTDGEFEGKKMKIIEFTPASPISISNTPVYVGYSIDIPDVYTDGNKSPLALYENEVPGAFQFHTSQSVVRWYDYSPTLGKVPLIIVELEGEQPENSLLLSSLDEGYVQLDGEISLKAYVVNTGSSPVKNIRYTYSIDGVEAGSATLDFNPALSPDMACPQVIKPIFSGFDNLGKVSLSMTVTEVNGGSNGSLGATASTDMQVKEFLAYKKPLVEEYTGMWCGYCPAGYVSMEAAKEKFGSQAVLICYHYDDALSPQGADYPEVSGYPSLMINRGDKIDAYFGTHPNFDLGMLRDIQNNIGIISEAAVSLENMAIEDDILKFDVAVMPVADKENADYRIGYVLTEDNRQDQYYSQVNYYSGNSRYYNTALDYFAKAGGRVSGLVYQDVALDIESRHGIEGLLPSSLEAGKWYTSSFSIDLSENPLVSDYNNLAVAVILVDGSTGEVLNSEKAYFGAEAGIELPVADAAEVVAVSYYTLDGRRVSNPGRGMYVVVNRMSDGTTKTMKKLIN